MINQNKNSKFLEGEKVYLIPIEEQHIDLYYEKLSHTSFDNYKYTGSKVIITKTGIQNFIQDIVNDRSRVDFFIVCMEDDEIVGEIVLNDIDWMNRSANIRLAIFEDKNYNKKYGSDAMRLVLNYGFGMYPLHRIELQVYSFNKRAIHVYEKLGFKKEGILRDYLYFGHVYYDAIVMSILETEFNK